MENKYCERCGKKLGTEVTDIHTCTPIRKEWVGLTDEDINYIEKEYITSKGIIRATELKLKEKNNG